MPCLLVLSSIDKSTNDQENLPPGLSVDLTRRLELDEQEKMSLPRISRSSMPERTFVWSEIYGNIGNQSQSIV